MWTNISRAVGGSLAALGVGALLAACGSGLNPVGAANSMSTTVALPATSTASGNADSTSRPVYVDENSPNGPQLKPSEIDFYEYTEMSGILWLSWGGPTAQGDGVLSDNDCTPDCATGHINRFSAHVVLSDIQTVHGDREYTRYTVTFDGQDQNPELARALTNQPTTPN